MMIDGNPPNKYMGIELQTKMYNSLLKWFHMVINQVHRQNENEQMSQEQVMKVDKNLTD